MILITGINGEMGSALIQKLSKLGEQDIIGLDIKSVDIKIKPYLKKIYIGDIKDKELIKKIFLENKITEIYHLAAILSTKAESIPFLSHQINVDGFLNLMSEIKDSDVLIKFFFASSIAIYCLNKKNTSAINEDEFCNPNNMYGCNKLYCEKLGTYFSQYSELVNNLDFRSIRFSGIISANTLPQGGTSDYAPEMVHQAIQNKNYTCFVKPHSCIPFMVMPDAIDAIVSIMSADKESLSRDVYHIQAFTPTVEDIYKKIMSYFPSFKLDYKINTQRQTLIDSWPSNLNQKAAKNDWGWNPKYNFDSAFDNYLIPKITDYYSKR
jgi:nucleoside-diphosphate-sugar epimerase